MKKLVALVGLAALFTSVAFADVLGQALPTTESKVVEDFEEGNTILAVRDEWNSFGNVFMKNQFSTEQGTTDSFVANGGTAGTFTWADIPEGGNKAAIFQGEAPFESWKGYKFFAVDINNPTDKDINLFFFFKTGPNWDWGQTSAVKVPAGKHTVVFKLGVSVLKTSSLVRQFGFMLDGEGNALPGNSIQMDNIRLYK